MDRINAHTQLLTLMAYPIRHSRSPAMHNEAFRYLGLDYAYLCFDVDQDNLKGAIDAMRALNVRGGNVSMPNKIEVMKYLDVISPDSQLFGAVNTIVNDDGVLTGYTTDGTGYTMALEDRGIDLAGKKLTVCGAGGIGKVIHMKSAMAGAAELSVFCARDKYWERAAQSVRQVNELTDCRAELFDLADLSELKRQIHDSYLLVNATSVGMHPLEGQTYIPDPSYFREGMYVMDVVYEPSRTKFLELAAQAGCVTINGLSLMLFQGAASFKLWTGAEMPIDHMKEFLGIDSAGKTK